LLTTSNTHYISNRFSSKHYLILIISGRNITQKFGNQKLVVFPFHLTALPGKTQNTEITPFHSNAA